MEHAKLSWGLKVLLVALVIGIWANVLTEWLRPVNVHAQRGGWSIHTISNAVWIRAGLGRGDVYWCYTDSCEPVSGL